MNWLLLFCASASVLAVIQRAEGKKSTRRGRPGDDGDAPAAQGGPGPTPRGNPGELGINDHKFTPLTKWEGGMEDGVLYRGYKTDKDMVNEP